MSIATIVIPCFNEAKRLDLAAFEQFAAENPDANFLFVDDGSADDTRQMLDRLADRISDRASVLVLEQNSGKAEAVRRGITRALEAEPTYVGYWDADLATPLPVIREFLKEHQVRKDYTRFWFFCKARQREHITYMGPLVPH